MSVVFKRGETIFKSVCTQCHAAKNDRRLTKANLQKEKVYTVAKIAGVVKNGKEKMPKQSGRVKTAADQTAVATYVFTRAAQNWVAE